MKKKTTLFLLGSAIVVGAAVVAVVIGTRPLPAARTSSEIQSGVKPAPIEKPDAAPAREESPVTSLVPSAEAAPTVASAKVKPSEPAPSTPPAKPPKELADPEARTALGLVGVDPEAEAYWLDAIYDSNLPDKEREDLIEDLNEDGLSDPKHPGPEDFPLIMNRLRIIEQIVPDADPFMLEHLWEAYKDLVNLAEVAQGGGKLIR